jgi:hypothetical protein
MFLFIAWKSSANQEIERATRSGEPEIARRASSNIDSALMLLQSWVLRSGGEMVVSQLLNGAAKVDASRLDELPDILRRVQETTKARILAGCGFEPQEAKIALDVAELRGGDGTIILYNEDIAREAHDAKDAEKKDELGPIAPENKKQDDGAPETDGGVGSTLNKAEGERKPGEASKIASGAKAPLAAAPSPVSTQKPISAPDVQPGAPGQPDQAQAPQEQSGEAQPDEQDPSQLKQAVAAVLQDVKTNINSIKQLQQTDPAAFQSITGLIQAFVAVAEQLFSGQEQDSEDLDHDEMVEKESKEHPSLPKEDIEQIVKDHESESSGSKLKPPGHHRVISPVGTVHDGKVKVRRGDGSTAWVSVRSGQIMSQSGHTISSRNPGGK